jgi:hypothetical protein
MRQKNFFLLNYFFFLAFLIIGSDLASGLLVSPGRVGMNFVPGYVYDGKVCYTITGISRLRFTVSGVLPDSITFKNLDENNEKIITPEDNCVYYAFKVPAKAPMPGNLRTNVYATEAPEDGGSFGAVVSVAHQVDVFVPYPGKYLEYFFSVNNVKAGEAVPMAVTITSKGQEVINSAQGFITIFDKNNKTLATVSTQAEKNIKTDEQRVLEAKWDSAGYKEGNYQAKLKLVYDEVTGNASAPFKLGGLDVNMLNYTREVIIGNLREFYVLVDSIWAENIPGVRAIVSIYNFSASKDKPLQSFETLTRTLAPWGTDNLKGYVDATNLNLGEYDIKIELYYTLSDLKKDYQGKFKVITEPVIKAPPKKVKLFTTQNLLIALGFLLIIFIILLMLTLLPKKKKGQAQQQPRQAASPGSKLGNSPDLPKEVRKK